MDNPSDWTGIVTAAIALLIAILNAWNQRKSKIQAVVKDEVASVRTDLQGLTGQLDGKLKEFVERAERAAHARGVLQEKQEAAVRKDER